MSEVLLTHQDVQPVAVGEPVRGAITSGPASIGNFSVVGDVTLPGSFTVFGSRFQVLNKVLQPGETYQGEPGVMTYMSPEVTMQARWGGWRMFSGEGLAKLRFVNTAATPGCALIPTRIKRDITLPLPLACAAC